MIVRLRKLQSDVTASAQRLDTALLKVGGEARDVRRMVRALSPKLLLGVGLAGGFLLMILPRHLRGSTLLGLGNFVLKRLMPMLVARDDNE